MEGTQGEPHVHLQEEKASSPEVRNRHNMLIRKIMKMEYDNIEVHTPYNYEGGFEPQILPKCQTILGEVLEYKIIGLQALEMSYTDICNYLEDIYQLQLSPCPSQRLRTGFCPNLNSGKSVRWRKFFPSSNWWCSTTS